MAQYDSLETPQDYVNYTFNVGAKGTAHVAGELAGLSNTVATVLGDLAFKTSEFLAHTEMVAIGVGAAVGAAFTAATNDAIRFQQQVANVKAIGGETVNAQLIGDKAIEYSNKFGMATSSMTEGLEALARAGITTTSVMAGVLEEGVKLSKLEGLDLEESINDLIATTNLLSPEDVDMNAPEYAEMLKAMNQHIVSTSESAPINAQNIIQTLQHAGGYVSAANIDQDDLFAVIAQLGSRGTKGEMAGTALRAFIAAGQKDQAQRALKRIGLDVTDLWTQSGEAMLPISEMKQVLDDALEARGYSKQEKLEFYSDFAGYKQANQIMKIDSSEAQLYKEKIADSWNLSTKLGTILGTVRGNLDRIHQIGINFMTKVGNKLLPIFNAILTPIRWGLTLLDKIPFSHTGAALLMIYISFKTILAVVNKIVPAVGGMFSTFDDGKEKVTGIRSEFHNLMKDIGQSKETLGAIWNFDADELRRQHGKRRGPSARSREEAELHVAGLMWQDTRDYKELGINFHQIDKFEQENWLQKVRGTKEFQEGYKLYLKQIRDKHDRYIENIRPISTDVDDYDDKTLKNISDYTKYIYDLLKKEDGPDDNRTRNKKEKEGEGEFTFPECIKICPDSIGLLAKAIVAVLPDFSSPGSGSSGGGSSGGGSFSGGSSGGGSSGGGSSGGGSSGSDSDDRIGVTVIKVEDDDDNDTNTQHDIPDLSKEIQAIKDSIRPFYYGDYSFDERYKTEEQLNKAHTKALKDLQQKINDFANIDINNINATQRARLEKSLIRKDSNFSSKYAERANTSDIKRTISAGVYREPAHKKLGIRDAQIKKMAEMLDIEDEIGTIDNINGPDKRKSQLKTIHQAFINQNKVTMDDILAETSKIWKEQEEKKDTPAYIPTRILANNLDMSKEIAEALTISQHGNIASNIQTFMTTVATQDDIDTAINIMFKHIKTNEKILADIEAEEIKYVMENIARIENTYDDLGVKLKNRFFEDKKMGPEYIPLNEIKDTVLKKQRETLINAIEEGLIDPSEVADEYIREMYKDWIVTDDPGATLNKEAIKRFDKIPTIDDRIQEKIIGHNRYHNDSYNERFYENTWGRPYYNTEINEYIRREMSGDTTLNGIRSKTLVSDFLEAERNINAHSIYRKFDESITIRDLAEGLGDVLWDSAGMPSTYKVFRGGKLDTSPSGLGILTGISSTAYSSGYAKEYSYGNVYFTEIIAPAGTPGLDNTIRDNGEFTVAPNMPYVEISRTLREAKILLLTLEQMDDIGFSPKNFDDNYMIDYNIVMNNVGSIDELVEPIYNDFISEKLTPNMVLGFPHPTDINDEIRLAHFYGDDGESYYAMEDSYNTGFAPVFDPMSLLKHVNEVNVLDAYGGIEDTIDVEDAVDAIEAEFADINKTILDNFMPLRNNTKEVADGIVEAFIEDGLGRHSPGYMAIAMALEMEDVRKAFVNGIDNIPIGVIDDLADKVEAGLIDMSDITPAYIQKNYSNWIKTTTPITKKDLEEKFGDLNDPENLKKAKEYAESDIATTMETIKQLEQKQIDMVETPQKVTMADLNANYEIKKAEIVKKAIEDYVETNSRATKMSLDTLHDILTEQQYDEEVVNELVRWTRESAKKVGRYTDSTDKFTHKGFKDKSLERFMNPRLIPTGEEEITLQDGTKIILSTHSAGFSYRKDKDTGEYILDENGNKIISHETMGKFINIHNEDDIRDFYSIREQYNEKLRHASHEDRTKVGFHILAGEGWTVDEIIRQVDISDSKLGEGWGTYNFSAAFDCASAGLEGFCEMCDGIKTKCYAVRDASRLPNVSQNQIARYLGWQLMTPEEREEHIKNSNIPVIRINQEGDFTSVNDYHEIVRLAKANPDVRFYGYTKNKDVLRFIDSHPSEMLDNLNINNSLGDWDQPHYGGNYIAVPQSEILDWLEKDYKLCKGVCDDCEACLNRMHKVTILRDGSQTLSVRDINKFSPEKQKTLFKIMRDFESTGAKLDKDITKEMIADVRKGLKATDINMVSMANLPEGLIDQLIDDGVKKKNINPYYIAKNYSEWINNEAVGGGSLGAANTSASELKFDLPYVGMSKSALEDMFPDTMFLGFGENVDNFNIMYENRRREFQAKYPDKKATVRNVLKGSLWSTESNRIGQYRVLLVDNDIVNLKDKDAVQYAYEHYDSVKFKKLWGLTKKYDDLGYTRDDLLVWGVQAGDEQAKKQFETINKKMFNAYKKHGNESYWDWYHNIVGDTEDISQVDSIQKRINDFVKRLDNFDLKSLDNTGDNVRLINSLYSRMFEWRDFDKLFTYSPLRDTQIDHLEFFWNRIGSEFTQGIAKRRNYLVSTLLDVMGWDDLSKEEQNALDDMIDNMIDQNGNLSTLIKKEQQYKEELAEHDALYEELQSQIKEEAELMTALSMYNDTKVLDEITDQINRESWIMDDELPGWFLAEAEEDAILEKLAKEEKANQAIADKISGVKKSVDNIKKVTPKVKKPISDEEFEALKKEVKFNGKIQSAGSLNDDYAEHGMGEFSPFGFMQGDKFNTRMLLASRANQTYIEDDFLSLRDIAAIEDDLLDMYIGPKNNKLINKMYSYAAKSPNIPIVKARTKENKIQALKEVREEFEKYEDDFIRQYLKEEYNATDKIIDNIISLHHSRYFDVFAEIKTTTDLRNMQKVFNELGVKNIKIHRPTSESLDGEEEIAVEDLTFGDDIRGGLYSAILNMSRIYPGEDVVNLLNIGNDLLIEQLTESFVSSIRNRNYDYLKVDDGNTILEEFVDALYADGVLVEKDMKGFHHKTTPRKNLNFIFDLMDQIDEEYQEFALSYLEYLFSTSLQNAQKQKYKFGSSDLIVRSNSLSLSQQIEGEAYIEQIKGHFLTFLENIGNYKKKKDVIKAITNGNISELFTQKYMNSYEEEKSVGSLGVMLPDVILREMANAMGLKYTGNKFIDLINISKQSDEDREKARIAGYDALSKYYLPQIPAHQLGDFKKSLEGINDFAAILEGTRRFVHPEKGEEFVAQLDKLLPYTPIDLPIKQDDFKGPNALIYGVDYDYWHDDALLTERQKQFVRVYEYMKQNANASVVKNILHDLLTRKYDPTGDSSFYPVFAPPGLAYTKDGIKIIDDESVPVGEDTQQILNYPFVMTQQIRDFIGNIKSGQVDLFGNEVESSANESINKQVKEKVKESVQQTLDHMLETQTKTPGNTQTKPLEWGMPGMHPDTFGGINPWDETRKRIQKVREQVFDLVMNNKELTVGLDALFRDVLGDEEYGRTWDLAFELLGHKGTKEDTTQTFNTPFVMTPEIRDFINNQSNVSQKEIEEWFNAYEWTEKKDTRPGQSILITPNIDYGSDKRKFEYIRTTLGIPIYSDDALRGRDIVTDKKTHIPLDSSSILMGNTSTDQARTKREKENQYNIRWLLNSLVLTKGQRGLIQRLLMKGDNEAIVKEIKRSNAQVSNKGAKTVADYLIQNPHELDKIREDKFKFFRTDEDFVNQTNAHIPLEEDEDVIYSSIFDSHFFNRRFNKETGEFENIQDDVSERNARRERRREERRERDENREERRRRRQTNNETGINWHRIRWDDQYYQEVMARATTTNIQKFFADTLRGGNINKTMLRYGYHDVTSAREAFINEFGKEHVGGALSFDSISVDIWSRLNDLLLQEMERNKEAKKAVNDNVAASFNMFDDIIEGGKFRREMEKLNKTWRETGQQINLVTAYLNFFARPLQTLAETFPILSPLVTPIVGVINKASQLGNLFSGVEHTMIVLQMLKQNTSKNVAKEAGMEEEWKDAEIIRSVFGSGPAAQQLYDILGDVSEQFTEYFGKIKEFIASKILVLVKFIISNIVIIGPIIAGIATTIAGLWYMEKQHAKALKETQEEIKDLNSTTLANLTTYKDLHQQRENETDALKRQQLARREAIALYQLELNGLKRLNAIHKQSQLQSDTLWGEYGMRAGWQRFTHGYNLFSGEFESKYENYDGATKNIRQIREEVVGNLFATSAQKEVAAFYDANILAFGEIEAFSKELNELYDKESQLIERYGSLEAARETEEFNKAVQEFSDATRLNGETAVKYLDWLETENKVDKATQAMQVEVDMIVAEATRNAFTALYPNRNFDDADGIRNAMIYAQADQMVKDAYHQLWWEAFGNKLWGYFNIIIGILNPADWIGEILGWEENRMDIANRHLNAAKAYDEGQKKLLEDTSRIIDIGEEAADNADRRNYGTTPSTNYGDTPFGFSLENAFLVEKQGIGRHVVGIQDLVYEGMDEAGQLAVSGFKEGLDQHSPGAISRSVGEEMQYTMEAFEINKEPIGMVSYDVGYESGQEYGKGFRDGLNDLYAQISTPEALGESLKKAILYDTGLKNSSNIQQSSNDEIKETTIESAADAAGFIAPEIIEQLGKKAIKKGAMSAAKHGTKIGLETAGEVTGKAGLKTAGKTFGKIAPFIGPFVTAGFAIAEHNPFEKHYNEDGSEKRAFQSTGEVVGEVAGSVAAMGLGLVATAFGGPVAGAIVDIVAGLVLEPVGKAIGGTIGWIHDEIVNTPLDKIWEGANDFTHGTLGAIYNLVDNSVFGQLGHSAFGFLDKQTGGWLSKTWDDVSHSSIAGIAGKIWNGSPIGMLWNWLSGGNNEEQQTYEGYDMSKVGKVSYESAKKAMDKKPKNISTDNSKSTIIIKNININTEDDPEKIKTAFMNLMVEMEEQISPRQVSRVIGEPPAAATNTATTTDPNNPNATTDPNNPNATTDSTTGANTTTTNNSNPS